jgi:hypothetical protein
MQSMEEHQEIPKEASAVMPAGGLRKRRRDWNMATGRRQKLKGRIQASNESRRRLTVASRKLTRSATGAWRKRIVFRKIGAQENCGPLSKLTAVGINMTGKTSSGKTEPGKDERATEGVRPLRKNLRMHNEGKCGTKDLCGGQRQGQPRTASEGGAQDSGHTWKVE